MEEGSIRLTQTIASLPMWQSRAAAEIDHFQKTATNPRLAHVHLNLQVPVRDMGLRGFEVNRTSPSSKVGYLSGRLRGGGLSLCRLAGSWPIHKTRKTSFRQLKGLCTKQCRSHGRHSSCQQRRDQETKCSLHRRGGRQDAGT
jgi:hypothetical protein